VAVSDFIWAAVNARRRATGQKELDMLELYAYVTPKVSTFGSLWRVEQGGGTVGRRELDMLELYAYVTPKVRASLCDCNVI